MSRMADLELNIIELLEEGMKPHAVATQLSIPLEMVYDTIQAWEEGFDKYDDSMDGDFDSGMASAGFGTDEDYGYYGDE